MFLPLFYRVLIPFQFFVRYSCISLLLTALMQVPLSLSNSFLSFSCNSLCLFSSLCHVHAVFILFPFMSSIHLFFSFVLSFIYFYLLSLLCNHLITYYFSYFSPFLLFHPLITYPLSTIRLVSYPQPFFLFFPSTFNFSCDSYLFSTIFQYFSYTHAFSILSSLRLV